MKIALAGARSPMDARKVVVTLVCAAPDADAVDEVIDGLSASGREVELVSGVDEEPRKVGEAIDRCGQVGMVVVCTSEHLDGPLLRTVEGLFGARRGPGHAIIRIELSLSPAENVTAIRRAVDAFVGSQGRIVRHGSQGPSTREVVAVDQLEGLALPVVRLEPGEELDGDTRRIQLPDNPKSAELSRRRRAAREREKQRERITSVHRHLDESESSSSYVAARSDVQREAAKLDRLMIVMVVGAGLLAILAALVF